MSAERFNFRQIAGLSGTGVRQSKSAVSPKACSLCTSIVLTGQDTARAYCSYKVGTYSLILADRLLQCSPNMSSMSCRRKRGAASIFARAFVFLSGTCSPLLALRGHGGALTERPMPCQKRQKIVLETEERTGIERFAASSSKFRGTLLPRAPASLCGDAVNLQSMQRRVGVWLSI